MNMHTYTQTQIYTCTQSWMSQTQIYTYTQTQTYTCTWHTYKNTDGYANEYRHSSLSPPPPVYLSFSVLVGRVHIHTGLLLRGHVPHLPPTPWPGPVYMYICIIRPVYLYMYMYMYMYMYGPVYLSIYGPVYLYVCIYIYI
jgi:hypothetical protein